MPLPNVAVGLSSLPAKIAGSVADASTTGAELRSSVSRSEHVTGLGAGLDIQRRQAPPPSDNQAIFIAVLRPLSVTYAATPPVKPTVALYPFP